MNTFDLMAMLGWSPKVAFAELVGMMMEADLAHYPA